MIIDEWTDEFGDRYRLTGVELQLLNVDDWVACVSFEPMKDRIKALKGTPLNAVEIVASVHQQPVTHFDWLINLRGIMASNPTWDEAAIAEKLEKSPEMIRLAIMEIEREPDAKPPTCKTCDHQYKGKCLRNPPQTFVTDGGQIVSRFPRVADGSRCGEHAC